MSPASARATASASSGVGRRRILRFALHLRRRQRLQPQNRAAHGPPQRVFHCRGAGQRQRGAPGDIRQKVAGNGIGGHHHRPAIEQRQALHRVQRIQCLIAKLVDELRGRDEHLGAETVRRERDRNAFHLGFRRGRFGGFGLRGGRARLGGLGLDDRAQGRGESGALGRIVQHVQRRAGLVRRDAARRGRRRGRSRGGGRRRCRGCGRCVLVRRRLRNRRETRNQRENAEQDEQCAYHRRVRPQKPSSGQRQTRHDGRTRGPRRQGLPFVMAGGV